MRAYKPLALMAADAEDLKAVSALLQDAIVKIGDAAWLKGERRFAFVANRYVWEEAAKKRSGPGHRVRAGVHFDDVRSVRARNVRMDAPEAFIDILNAEYEGGEDGGTITINLAGGGEIALDVDAVNATVKDLSEPWRASRRPDHKDD